jgi:aspartate carbamoyltransferase
MKNPWYQKDILSVDQFTKADLRTVTQRGHEMRQLVLEQGGNDLLKGRIMTALFYEPSSRTFGSFIPSMQRLGGGVIPIQGVTYSSVSKGEQLVDTIRTFASFSDIVVLRHPEVGSARLAAEFCDQPVINAGDGIGEHPTQALLDFFTISGHFDGVKGLHIAMVGDLLNGRTIHSLSKLLSLYSPITISLVSPEILRLPQELQKKLEKKGLKVKIYEELADVLPKADVLYITRVQKERFLDLEMYEKVKHQYVITPKVIKGAKKTAIIMHPFPRVGEISLDVDLDKRAVYIREQMKNGMYIRMALLSLILKQ